MLRTIAGSLAILLGAMGFLWAPHSVGTGVRNELASLAVRAHIPAVAVSLLKPLADAGDPLALNNLGVLTYRGIGTLDHHPTAKRLFEAASQAGLKRGELNLLLMQGRCTSMAQRDVLEDLVFNGEPRAASYVLKCNITPEPTNYCATGRRERELEMIRIALVDGLIEEQLLFWHSAVRCLSMQERKRVDAPGICASFCRKFVGGQPVRAQRGIRMVGQGCRVFR